MRRILLLLTLVMLAAASGVTGQKPAATPEQTVDFSGTWLINKHDVEPDAQFGVVVIAQNGVEIRMAKTELRAVGGNWRRLESGMTINFVYYTDGRGEVHRTLPGGLFIIESKTNFKGRSLIIDEVFRDAKSKHVKAIYKWEWKLSKDGKELKREYIGDSSYWPFMNGRIVRYNRAAQTKTDSGGFIFP